MELPDNAEHRLSYTAYILLIFLIAQGYKTLNEKEVIRI